MARNIQSLLRITSNVLNQNINKNLSLGGTRTLYAAAALGLDGYKRTRESIQQQFLTMSDKFREKMHAYVEGESRNMIFTEDLKNMLHLVDGNETDLELLSKMMVKFNQQNKEMRFGSFVFGPVVMRAYYYLDKPDQALAAFNDPALEGFFDQIITYQILMDLLYNHSKWAELRQVFESISARNTDFSKHPKHAITLILAGCYKENTPESMKYALDLWQELKERGHFPMRRSSTFFAGLALNQGKPEIATEVLFNVKQGSYVTVRNLKVAGLADLNRLDDVVPILRMSLTHDNPSQVKQTYTKEVIEKVEEAIQRAQLSGNETIVNLVRQLRQNGHVIDTKLDDLISAEIAAYPRTMGDNRNLNNNTNYNSNYNSNQNSNHDSFDNYRPPRPRRQFNMYQRPGLKELI